MNEKDEDIYLRYIAKEDDKDLEMLLTRYRDGLFLFLLGFVKNEEDAEDLMRRLGIMETAKREITEVSGGQLQRACLARALINSPKVVFADEPTGALNSKASLEVMNELVNANKAGTTVLMVTHSEKVAASSDRILYLVDGDIRGELVLGKMEGELSLREKKVRKWLEEMGW